ncbi:FtsX-like permease family protein [Corallococcus sp. AB018]|uniref:ADOP family duplicated permease n=1 Tax=Corallococcus sp. AB018 TaxID=2316715 RepID=UPI000F877445|nr:ADOP family duplicated permease [Corallococcus sp. AB018]RUO89218.1 FtsX-like permease family protein [Corallococcus sp. AB018]
MLLHEVRRTLRSMAREKLFTAVVVLTLALTIGATTAVFSVVYPVLWQPLPYPESEQLVRLFQATTPGAGAGPHKDRTRVSLPVWNAWREGARSFSGIEGVRVAKQLLGGAGLEARLTVGRASSGLMPLLGGQPALGRLWGTEGEVPGRDRELVLTHALWQRLYGADPAVLGRSVLLDDTSHVIVGVLPEDFRFEPEVEAWKPLALDVLKDGGNTLRVVGRMRPGVSLEQARGELLPLTLAAADVPGEPRVGVHVEPLHAYFVEQSLSQLQIAAGAAVLLLLLGCSNLTNLLLARGSARMHELSVRLALGATRWQLVRQVFVESAVRAAFGGVGGLLLALWGRGLLTLFIPGWFVSGPGLEPSLLGIVAAVSLATAVLVGVLPALHASRGEARAVLAPMVRGGRGATSLGWARSALVVAQLSLALVPLVGAGLMLRTLWKLQAVPLGFEPEHVTVAEVFFPLEQFPDEARASALAQALIARMETLAGVDSAGLTAALPFSGEVWRETAGFHIVGMPPPSGMPPRTGYVPASAGAFRAMGIALKQGRLMDAGDTADHPPVVVVSEAFARRYLPGREPVGVRLQLERDAAPREVIGVVGDVPMERISVAPSGDLYVPLGQDMRKSLNLAVKSSLPAPQLLALLQEEVRAADPNLRLLNVRPLDRVVEAGSARVRVLGGLLAAFALLGAVLASVGLYGLLAFWVTQRTRELGIRSALGATPRGLLRLVVTQGLRLTGLGLAVGLLGAGLLARALSAMLYGITPHDPLIFVGAPALLFLTALAASWIPAVAATRVSPAEALKQDA